MLYAAHSCLMRLSESLMCYRSVIVVRIASDELHSAFVQGCQFLRLMLHLRVSKSHCPVLYVVYDQVERRCEGDEFSCNSIGLRAELC